MDDIGINATLARIQQIQATMAGARGTAATAVTADPSSPSGTSAQASFAGRLAQAQALEAMSAATADGDAATGGDATASSLTAMLQGAAGQGATPGAAGALAGMPAGQVLTLDTPAGRVPVMVLGTSAGAVGATGAATASLPAAAPVATAATGYAAPAGTGAGTAGPTGQRIAAIATAELGQRESPRGSNDGPRIAEYRTATRGAGVGPWCAYFTSWVGRQAGVPVGDGGKGHGWVPDVQSWGQRTGRWIPSGSATRAQAGDLVVFDRNRDGLADHIGVVTGVRPDGGIATVEGNSSDAVSARSYGRGEWAGLVRMAAPGA